MADFLIKIQNIDRRYLYGLLIFIVTLTLVFPANLPIAVTPQVKGLYNAIESIPPGKMVILSIVWDAGTVAENAPQTEAIMRHLFKRNVPFAIVAFAQQGAKLSSDLAEKVAKEYGKTYGVDWCSWGYKANLYTFIIGLGQNLPKAVEKDAHGTPIKEIPMMKGIKSIEDIGLVVDITPSATLEYWIAFVQGVYGTPLGYAPTAVMVPEGYNPLDAGQIKGMLPGLIGAGQYEVLIKHKGFGTKAAGAQSATHMLIVLLIILGNLGYLFSRRKAAR